MKCNPLPYKRIVFVCLNERPDGVCCANGNAAAIHAQLKAAVKARGLGALVRVSRAGCMNRCGSGPNVMVFPDNRWYSEVTEADVMTILDEITNNVAAPE